MSQTFDIVISYRREDTQATSSAIYREMVRRFGADRVLLDITSVPVGEDYQRFVDGIIARARALIVVIGPEWSTVEKDGVRRLDREDDAVRAEVVAALATGVPIIPLLVDGASAPEARALPQPLRPLSRLNMMPLSERHWDADMQTLAKRLAPLLGVEIKDVSPRTGRAAQKARDSVRDHPRRWLARRAGDLAVGRPRACSAQTRNAGLPDRRRSGGAHDE